MSHKTINLTEKVYDYLLSVSLREHEVLRALRQETAKLNTGTMQISPEQGQFMALLIELMGARKTLDIGVYTGYSSLSVALALPKEGKVIACDINEEWTQIAKTFWEKGGVRHKIELRLAPAADTLNLLLEQGQANTFDFAFIDADKSNYDIYYEKSLQLIRSGGLIAIDNTLWDGEVADESIQNKSTVSLRKLNNKIHRDERVTMSLLPIGDGLTLARRRY